LVTVKVRSLVLFTVTLPKSKEVGETDSVGEVELTVVTAVTALLAVSRSVSFLVTLAVLLMVPATVGVTTIVTVALAPLARVPRVQVMVLVPLQLPWLADEETNVTPEGRVSVTATPVAVLGPLLVTVMV
jgi:hypothetical protein